MTPRRRCQPSSGAARSEPVFPTKREGPARGRRRHAVAVEALAPPDAARVAIRIATRVATVYTNAPKRPRGAISTDLCTLLRPHGRSQLAQQPNSVHKRPNPARKGPILPFVYTVAIPRLPTTQAHGPIVYTNAPKRRRGAISTNLCTLLRHHPGGEAHAVGAVTQPPTHTNSRSLSYEIDFVVGWGEDVIGIEVKSGRVRSTGGLTAFSLLFPGARTLVIGSPACTVGSFLLREHDPFSARAPRAGLRRRSAVARLVRLWGRAFRKRTCATYRRS